MKLVHRIALVIAFLSPLGASTARAQMGGPPMPMGMDVQKAVVGSYGDYEITMGGTAPMKMRLALVARQGTDNVVETTVEGGMMAMVGGKMTARMVLDKTLTAGKLVMQLANTDPMEMPAQPGMPAGQKLQRPDPKDLIGKETLKVKGGTIKTQHYRSKNGMGMADVWFSDEAPPFGLVKMEGSVMGPSGSPEKMTMELVGRGKNAKPTITKPVKPFDPSVLTRGLAPPQK